MSRCKLALFSISVMATTTCAPAFYVAGLGAAFAGTRAREAKIHEPDPDSAEGLKQELKDMREVARKGRPEQLRAMVTDLEIPDARAWYSANFGNDGPERADFYEEGLAKSEQRLENQMIEFAREDGYFSVKKQDAKKAYPYLATAPGVFLAVWEKTSAYGDEPFETPVGYFLFVNGKFRWDSTVGWVTVD